MRPRPIVTFLSLVSALLCLSAQVQAQDQAQDQAQGETQARASEAQSEAAPPNIVFVLIDDMGFGDLSCYGETEVETQNIDRLAFEGLRFEQFYVASPICSPSRAAFMTGHYPQRWGITSYIDHRELNERRGMKQWLDLEAPSIARQLQAAGYATGHFGKWHLGGGRDVGDAPLITEYGFDESLTQFEGLGNRILGLFSRGYGEPAEKRGLERDSAKLGRGNITWMDRSVMTQAYAAAAADFIRQAKDDDKPFFVNVWLDDVHTPLHPPEGWEHQDKRGRYLAVVEAMDEQLEDLFNLIRFDSELRQNTIIIVASDNGAEPGAGVPGPLKGWKTELWEGGVREPLIVWAPGLMPLDAVATTNTETVLHATDFLPTLVKLAGAELPEGFDGDGQEMVDALLGKAKPIREGKLFWRRPPDRPGPDGNPLPDLSVREGNWKLLCNFDGSNAQLFDVAKDIDEQNDVASQNPDVTETLKNALLDWNKSMPQDKPMGE